MLGNTLENMRMLFEEIQVTLLGIIFKVGIERFLRI